MKRLEWYVQILVKRLLKGEKLQHFRRGIYIEKQIQKRDATFANTISKFDSISFAVESVKEFQEGTFGPTPYGKNVINKTLVQLKVLGVIFHNLLLVMKHKSISYRKIVFNCGPLNHIKQKMSHLAEIYRLSPTAEKCSY